MINFNCQSDKVEITWEKYQLRNCLSQAVLGTCLWGIKLCYFKIKVGRSMMDMGSTISWDGL